MNLLRERYIHLLKNSLADALHQRTFVAVIDRSNPNVTGQITFKLTGTEAYKDRIVGLDWPASAETMIGLKRLDNLEFCMENIVANKIPGDFIETGIWRGGATIFMRGWLCANDITDRKVWACDSFEGLPKANLELHPIDGFEDMSQFKFLSVSEEEVKENFRRYGLLDDQVCFVRGWFKDTLPKLKDRKWSLIRLDGDLYESTINGLENLYDGLSSGGYIIIDDYGCLECCREAVRDFRTSRKITAPIQEIDWTGVYWQKP